MKKIIVVLVAFVSVTAGFGLSRTGEGRAVAADGVEAVAIEAMKAQILASTIQIEVFERERVEGDMRHIRSSRGLGTVVQLEGQRFILTHDHWSIGESDLNRVEIRNGNGEELVVLDGPSFYGMVRYRDGGTMVLEVPVGLEGVNGAEIGFSAMLAVGGTVWLATNGEGGTGIRIETAWIEEVDGAEVPGRLMLRAEETAVISGDSGGGVWVDGRVVGALWAIRVAERELFWGIDQKRPTGSIIVGIQPLLGVTGVTAQDLLQEPTNEWGYEWGRMID